MTKSELFADVILPFPLPQYFTYLVPEELQNFIEIGKRSVVQFGKKRFYTAIIANIHSQKPIGYETKSIISVLDDYPIVNSFQLQFWHWVANYYMCSMGEVMKAALPAGLKLESESLIYYNESFKNFNELTPSEDLVLGYIKNKFRTNISEIKASGLKSNLIAVIYSLYHKEAILLEESLKSGFSAKTETLVKLTEEASNEKFLIAFLDSLKRAVKQREVLFSYIRLSGIFENSNVTEVNKKALLEISGTTSNVLKSLVEKGIFDIYTKEISRLDSSEIPGKEISPLTDTQNKIKQTILEIFDNKDIVLLHGITGSGKTEIYLHLIRETIATGKQVLYLLPEIAITAQIINRLKIHFGKKVGIYHSKFSDNERVETWNRLNSDNPENYQIILGVRSSIFLPFSNLGLVIVDEEHENSFKQFDPAPRYHARDAAIVLAKLHGAKVLLGTATPSVESYYNTQIGKYGLVSLMDRFQGIKLPAFHIVNLRVARKKGHMKSHFSDELLEKISNSLEKQKQIILFQNRRGFSPFIECDECGWIQRCKHCDVTLTYHKYQNQLTCHYCGFALDMPKYCNTCKSTNLQTRGFGTEKIEEELAIYFPSARIARMDLDATRQKNAHEKIIAAFENQQTDILVGTQMVTKGLDFANVGLVGILDADSLLNYPDFRSSERGFQLMVQVSGRAGRKDEQGLALVQTSTPGHSIIQYVLKNDFAGMYHEQIEERKQFKYPPFVRLIRISLKHKNADTVVEIATNLEVRLRKFLGSRVIGPDIPIISRIQNLHIRNILLKIEREANIAKVKEKVSEIIGSITQQFKTVQISIDVDPA